MKLTQSKTFNSEYCARIVHITHFEVHPNPKCTRMKCALVGAFSIAVSLDTEPGYFVYFPVGSQICTEYLHHNNLYRKAELNKDQQKTGFFEDSRRVKPIKLQGVPSEGFIAPCSSLLNWFSDDNLPELTNNLEFDTVNDIQLVKRYIVKANTNYKGKSGKDGSKRSDLLIPGQFKFHYDTDSLEKCPWVITPNSLITVTEKVHGTSQISAWVLSKKPVQPSIKAKDKQGKKLLSKNKLKKILAKLKPSYKIDYDYLYSSRKVIQDIKYNPDKKAGFYGNDAFRAFADNAIRPHLIKGMTVYYEIAGYTTIGNAVQKINGVDMDYGCEIYNDSEPYTLDKHFKIFIYRITLTNPDGDLHEFSAHEVQLWCNQHGLNPVKELYWGFAKDLYPDIPIDDPNWSIKFCQHLKQDSQRFYMELDSPSCKNPVPHEGIVIRIDDGKSAAFKVKTFRFLSKEDKDYGAGIVNIEDQDLT